MKGTQLKQLRSTLNWTIDHAASQFNLPESSWARMEKDHEEIPDGVSHYMLQQTKFADTLLPAPAHLKLFRKHFGLTQSFAAALTGVTRVTWSRWEKAHTRIPTHMIHTLRGMIQLLKSQQQGEETKE